MNEETCPACGEPLVRKTSGRGAVLSAGHEVDGPDCRLAAWSREVERLGLVRVVGRVAKYLCELGFVKYGPFLLSEVQAVRDAEADGPSMLKKLRSGRVTSAFAPRWAYEVARAFGTVVGDALCKTSEKLEFVRGDEDLQRSVEAAAMLAESASDARKAVAAVVRSAMQEVKGGVGSKIVGENGGDCD